MILRNLQSYKWNKKIILSELSQTQKNMIFSHPEAHISCKLKFNQATIHIPREIRKQGGHKEGQMDFPGKEK